MKKSLILVLLFPLYLFSATYELSTTYKEGLKYYKEKKFNQSYQLFHKIYLDQLFDLDFNFRFGRSAYETGHYEMALAAFERVQMQDPTNLRNKLEMARTYYMLKMYEDSENAFREVLENPNIPKNIRTNIELSLSKVSKVQEKSFTYARAMMNILYDSNVNYGSLGDYQYGGGKLDKIEGKSDIALELFANITNIYDIGQKNGFAIKNSFDAYAKEYYEENDFSTLYFAYSPSLLYKETKFTSSLAFVADLLYLNDEQFLNTFSLIPSLQYNHTATLSSITYFKYQAKKFLQEGQDQLNANRYELSYGLQSILSPRSYIQGNILLINESSQKSTNNIYVNLNEYKANIVYANQLYSKVNLNIFAQARLRKYKDYSIGFDSIREDIGGLLNANIAITLLPTLQATLKTSYEYVNSNQDRFTYQKYTISAGIVKTF